MSNFEDAVSAELDRLLTPEFWADVQARVNAELDALFSRAEGREMIGLRGIIEAAE